MRRLVCAFVSRKPPKTGFLASRLICHVQPVKNQISLGIWSVFAVCGKIFQIHSYLQSVQWRMIRLCRRQVLLGTHVTLLFLNGTKQMWLWQTSVTIASWHRGLRGRVLDSRPRGHRFRRHCVVSLSLVLVGLTQEDLSRHNWKIVDWDVKNQVKQKHPDFYIFL